MTGDGSDAVSDEVRERIEADPYCETLGVELVALSPGTATTRLVVREELLNFHGTPHGGAIYSLADAAFAAASNSHGDTALAMETNLSFLEAVEVGTALTATAEETHLTDRTAEYEVVVSEEGRGARDEGRDVAADGDDDREERVATFRGRVYRP